MKKLVLVTVVFLAILSAFSQKWEQYIGLPNRSEGANDIIEIYDKGLFITGIYLDDLTRGWTVKTDVNGNLLYDKSIEHSLYSLVETSAASDTLGNIYICGILFFDGSWPMVTKYNPCGEKEWCKAFVNDSFNDGVGLDIMINENGDVIVLVAHNCDDDVDQILLYCLNNDGELLWTKPYASKNDHPEIAVAIGYNLYHYNNSYFIDGYCYWPYPGNPGQVYLRPLFIKIDSLFNEQWILPFGVSDSIVGEAYGTVPLNDSVYFGIGVRVSSATYNQNSLLMFFNEKGEEIGYNQITNEDFGENVDFNTMAKIKQANDSTFITKFYLGINDTVYHGETVIDTSGIIYKKQVRGIGGAIPDMIKTSDNNFLVAIEIEESKGDKDIWLYKIDENLEQVPFDTNTYVYDSLCPGGIQSGTIDITNCIIWTDVDEIPTPQEYYTSVKTVHIKAYPNPVKDGKVTFEFQNTLIYAEMELKCFDVFGELVYEEKVYEHQGEMHMDISSWNNGMYLGVICNNGQVLGNCKFIIKQ